MQTDLLCVEIIRIFLLIVNQMRSMVTAHYDEHKDYSCTLQLHLGLKAFKQILLLLAAVFSFSPCAVIKLIPSISKLSLVRNPHVSKTK